MSTSGSLSPRTLALMDAAELVSQPPIVSLEPTASRTATAASQSTNHHRGSKRSRPSNEDTTTQQRQNSSSSSSAHPHHHHHRNHRYRRSASKSKGNDDPHLASSSTTLPENVHQSSSLPSQPPPQQPKWKPYSQLSWEEKLQLEEYEKYKEIEFQKKLELRTKKRRAPVDSRGKVRPGVSVQDFAPPTPRNTTSKIIEEHQKYREQKHQQHQFRRSLSKGNTKAEHGNHTHDPHHHYPYGDDHESIEDNYSSSNSSEVHSSDIEGIGDFFDRLEQEEEDDEGDDNNKKKNSSRSSTNHDERMSSDEENEYTDEHTQVMTRINSGTTVSSSTLVPTRTNRRNHRTRGTSFDDTLNLDPSALLALGSPSLLASSSNLIDKDNTTTSVHSFVSPKDDASSSASATTLSSSSSIEASRTTTSKPYNSWDPHLLATRTVTELVQLVLILRDFNKRLLDRAIAAETEVALLRSVPTSSYYYEEEDNNTINNNNNGTVSTRRRRRLHPHYRPRRSRTDTHPTNNNDSNNTSITKNNDLSEFSVPARVVSSSTNTSSSTAVTIDQISVPISSSIPFPPTIEPAKNVTGNATNTLETNSSSESHGTGVRKRRRSITENESVI